MYAARVFIDDVAQAGLAAFDQRRFDVFYLCLCIDGIGQLLKNAPGLVEFADGDEITRGFGNEEKGNQEDGGRNDLHPEHPLIGLKSAPEHCTGAARHAGQPVIADECSEESDHDHQLLQRCQASPDLWWRNLADVCRSQNACGAHREAAENAGKDKLKRICRYARTPCTCDERDCRHHHYGFPADPVGKVSGKKGACGTAQQHRSHIEAGAYGIGIEGELQGVYGTVDDATVEAEQETADGGDNGQEQNPSYIPGTFNRCFVCLLHGDPLSLD